MDNGYGPHARYIEELLYPPGIGLEIFGLTSSLDGTGAFGRATNFETTVKLVTVWMEVTCEWQAFH